MTIEQFEKAEILKIKINKIKSFISYYDEYNMSITLSNDRDSSYHTENYNCKDDEDIKIKKGIKKYINDRLLELEKEFESI